MLDAYFKFKLIEEIISIVLGIILLAVVIFFWIKK